MILQNNQNLSVYESKMFCGRICFRERLSSSVAYLGITCTSLGSTESVLSYFQIKQILRRSDSHDKVHRVYSKLIVE